MSQAHPDLQELGTDCTRLIQASPEAWREDVDWLKQLPAMLEAKTEIDGDIVVQEEPFESFGPVCLRLMRGFHEAMAPMNDRYQEDRYAELNPKIARRLVLLTALAFNAGFDGAVLGIWWPWEVPTKEDEDELQDGRSWAGTMLLSQPGEGQELYERINRSLNYIQAMDSQPSTQNSSDGDDNETSSHHIDTDEQDEEQQTPALTKSERLTLCTLATFDASIRATAIMVAEKMPAAERLSDRTLLNAIRKLITLDLAERDGGKNSGARLTLKGRRLVATIAD